MGSIEVGVPAGTGLQHQDILCLVTCPDSGEENSQVSHQRFSAGLKDFSECVTLAEGHGDVSAHLGYTGALRGLLLGRAHLLLDTLELSDVDARTDESGWPVGC